MNKTSKIYLAGHRGLVGSAMQRRLIAGGYTNVVTRTHAELDLTRQEDVEAFFATENRGKYYAAYQQSHNVVRLLPAIRYHWPRPLRCARCQGTVDNGVVLV